MLTKKTQIVKHFLKGYSVNSTIGKIYDLESEVI